MDVLDLLPGVTDQAWHLSSAAVAGLSPGADEVDLHRIDVPCRQFLLLLQLEPSPVAGALVRRAGLMTSMTVMMRPPVPTSRDFDESFGDRIE